jgi:hypothetical protein
MSGESLLFDAAGNLKLFDIFVNSWFFGSVEFGVAFLLIATSVLLARFGLNIGQIITANYLLLVIFATVTGSIFLWIVVILVTIASMSRFVINLLFRV